MKSTVRWNVENFLMEHLTYNRWEKAIPMFIDKLIRYSDEQLIKDIVDELASRDITVDLLTRESE